MTEKDTHLIIKTARVIFFFFFFFGGGGGFFWGNIGLFLIFIDSAQSLSFHCDFHVCCFQIPLSWAKSCHAINDIYLEIKNNQHKFLLNMASSQQEGKWETCFCWTFPFVTVI